MVSNKEPSNHSVFFDRRPEHSDGRLVSVSHRKWQWPVQINCRPFSNDERITSYTTTRLISLEHLFKLNQCSTSLCYTGSLKLHSDIFTKGETDIIVLLTEVTLHSRALVLLKLGDSVAEEGYYQLLCRKRNRLLCDLTQHHQHSPTAATWAAHSDHHHHQPVPIQRYVQAEKTISLNWPPKALYIDGRTFLIRNWEIPV